MDHGPELGKLGAQDWNRLQDAAGRFEQAWQAGEAADLAEFLPPAQDPLRGVLLRELVKIDLEMRIRKGGRNRLEEYCDRFPELGAPATLPASLIYEEYLVRQRYGDHPELGEYGQRFPAQFAQLKKSVDEPGTLRSIAARSNPQTDRITFSEKEPLLHDTAPPSEPAEKARIPSAEGYLKLEYLGGGMFSDVWRGEAPGGCPVAIKIIRRPVDHKDVQGELKALELIKTLSHPFMARIDAYWVVDNRMHIAMELAEGTLRERLKDCQKAGLPAVPIDELLTYIRDAAEVIDYLHGENVIHRDIKPENILILKGHAKVADLGLAREMEERLQMSATGVGTPRYMAPEVWNHHVSKASDQYSLAMTYAELRLGRSPFTSKDMAGAMLDAIEGKADLSGLPEAEQQALAKALAKDPANRYPSCTAFIRAIEVALSVVPSAGKAKAPPKRRWTPARVLVPVAAVAVLVALGLVIAPLVRPSKTEGEGNTTLVNGPTDPSTKPPKTEPDPGTKQQSLPPVIPWPAKSPPRLLVLTTPDHAAVYIDDQRQEAVTPHEFEVKPGPVRVRVELPGYAPRTETRVVQADQKPQSILLTLAKLPPPPPTALSRNELYKRMVHASAWVRCYFPLADGTGTRVFSGTAWIVDREQRLLITNHHVVENIAAGGQGKVVDVCTTASLVFPMWKGSEPVVERDAYENAIQAGKLKPIQAHVLNSDPALDLALLQADSLPDGAIQLDLAAHSPGQGAALHSIGNPAASQALWGETEATVRQVYLRTDHYANGQDIKAWVIETQSATNPGDSGGPVVDDFGRLVGVTSSASVSPDARNMGYSIAVDDVQSFLRASQPWLVCKTPTDHLKRAGYYLDHNLYSLALADCEDALRNGTGSAAVFRIRGIARRRMEQPGALADLTKAIEGGARDALVYRERGLTQLKDHPRDALTDLNRAVELDGKDPGTRYARGVADLRVEKWQQAVDDFTMAEKGKYTPLLDIYVGRAEANFKLEHYDAVIEDSRRTLELEGLTPEQKARAFARGGDACAALGQRKQALEYYNDAIKIWPQDAETYNARGLLRWDSKDYDAAIADYTQAIHLDHVPDHVLAFFFFNRGLAYRAEGRKDETRNALALDDFTHAIQTDPKEASFYDTRAALHRTLGHLRLALKDNDMAVKLDSRNDKYFNSRGVSYYGLQQYKAAVDDYTRAININGKQAAYFYNRGQAYEAWGKKAEAQADYTRALGLNPNFKKASEALQGLSGGGTSGNP